MDSIVLVGFMGTGKTAVAKMLADLIGKKYVSLDERIIKADGRPIKDIFSQEGEPYFRKIEKEIVKQVSREKGLVIDTGGGVVLDEENMEELRSSGVVVCLWAKPETIYERTSRYGHRPLLNVDNPMEKIKELLEYRRPFYEKADIHIDTDELNVAKIADLIQRRVYEQGKD